MCPQLCAPVESYAFGLEWLLEEDLFESQHPLVFGEEQIVLVQSLAPVANQVAVP